MAKLVYGMNQSLDGYVDHLEFRPSPALFRHFIEQVRDMTGCVYGRRMYEVMRYWDEDCPDWPKFQMVDVAIQGLVHSIHELCHGTKSPPQVLQNSLSRRSAEGDRLGLLTTRR